MTQVNETKFSPVAFNPKGYATKRRKSDPKFAKAYAALNDEFAALAARLKARTAAGLTQADKKDHSPSLNTLRRYADACGMKLVIQMVAH